MTSGYIYRKLGVSFTKQPAEGVSGALGRWISDQRPRLNPSTRASASADKRAREVTGSGARRADRPGPTVGAPVRGWIRSNLFKSGPPDIRWMPETPWQDEAGSPWLPAAALPDSVAELHRRRGRVHARGSGALGRASVGSGGGGYNTGAKALEGGSPWRGGSAAAQLNSGERLRTHKGRKWEIRGKGRLVTSREDSGTFERR
jgi:hypothetical protein